MIIPVSLWIFFLSTWGWPNCADYNTNFKKFSYLICVCAHAGICHWLPGVVKIAKPGRGVMCNIIIDGTFTIKPSNSHPQLSTHGHFLEPNSLTLCTACSLPEAQLWLKMLISLLLALFSFSVKTCLESAFYSVMYTRMCQPSHSSDVELRCSKKIAYNLYE